MQKYFLDQLKVECSLAVTKACGRPKYTPIVQIQK